MDSVSKLHTCGSNSNSKPTTLRTELWGYLTTQVPNWPLGDTHIEYIWITLQKVCKQNRYWNHRPQKVGQERLFQDGRVEGCVLISCCKSTEVTTSCWTAINRKMLGLTKKDTPHSKTKQKLQWGGRRGAITLKSNPVSAKWVIHKLENNYTKDVILLSWRLPRLVIGKKNEKKRRRRQPKRQ